MLRRRPGTTRQEWTFGDENSETPLDTGDDASKDPADDTTNLGCWDGTVDEDEVCDDGSDVDGGWLGAENGDYTHKIGAL
ncbi:MAG: hypothetical protein ACJAYU_002495 [Bradymonadia bacterium]|jgi:hypothetical protein